jgi:murein DD-endopeptidase MepM/ murein hydrolase activator NlpD
MNNPLGYNDNTGHCAAEGATSQAQGCTPILPPPPNPWPLTNATLDLNGDGFVSDNEAIRAFGNIDHTASNTLLNDMKKPVRGEGIQYYGYGGCRTRALAGVSSCLEHHPGVDTYGKDSGATVYAAAYGRIIYVGWDGDSKDNRNLGYIVIIMHRVLGVELYSVYAHLDSDGSENVSIGQFVHSYTPIGIVGETGGAPTNPEHLHFEVRRATNVNLDPATNPSEHEYYWGYSVEELTKTRWVDLSSLYGRHAKFYNWS